METKAPSYKLKDFIPIYGEYGYIKRMMEKSHIESARVRGGEMLEKAVTSAWCRVTGLTIYNIFLVNGALLLAKGLESNL